MKRHIDQIQERKFFLDSFGLYDEHEFERLFNDCLGAATAGGDLDIYAVRSIAQFEVFTRHWVRKIVNHSREFAERAIPLAQNVKLDYGILLSTSERLITFGDLVAHAIPFSSLEHAISIFQALYDGKLSDDLPKVVDRRIYETTGVENLFIEDYQKVCGDVVTLFSLRHQICHEGASSTKTKSIDVAGCLKSLYAFVSALCGHFTEMLYGKVPLTPTAMNIDAIERYRIADERMKEVLEQLRLKCDGDNREVRLLNVTQASWERYRHLQSIFRYDPQGRGTIGPMLRASEAEELTIERTKHLLWYVEREEYYI